MQQYLLLFYGDESRWESISEDEREARIQEYGALIRDLSAQGKWIGGNQLQSTETATTVRVRDGEVLTTDGPFAETKEALGGYFLIDADSLDEALEWAGRIPVARDGMVEVRPIVMREAEVPQ
jgi:hypothetical protein